MSRFKYLIVAALTGVKHVANVTVNGRTKQQKFDGQKLELDFAINEKVQVDAFHVKDGKSEGVTTVLACKVDGVERESTEGYTVTVEPVETTPVDQPPNSPPKDLPPEPESDDEQQQSDPTNPDATE